MALDPSLERACAAQRRQDFGRPGRIVAGLDHVSEPKGVGLIFLVAREAQQIELRAGGEDVGNPGAEDGADDLAEDSERISFSILLANVGVIGGNVADLMTERKGKLRLVVHQAHQLAGHVDIASWYRESVLDR